MLPGVSCTVSDRIIFAGFHDARVDASYDHSVEEGFSRRIRIVNRFCVEISLIIPS